MDNGQVQQLKAALEPPPLGRRMDVNLCSPSKRSLLHAAAELGAVDAVEYLLERGVDHMLRDDNGNTALHLAVSAMQERGLHSTDVATCDFEVCRRADGR